MSKRNILTFVILFSSVTSVLLAAEPYQKMAKELSRGIIKLKNPRVAVLALPYHNGIENNGSAMVAERLITQLAQLKGFRIIERNLLRKLLEEHALSETGVLDENSTKQIGKILGVDALVSGTLIDLGTSQTEVNARVLDAQTGAILMASRGVVPKTWLDSSLVRKPVPRSPNNNEDQEKPVENELIKIGMPAGRPGYGSSRGR